MIRERVRIGWLGAGGCSGWRGFELAGRAGAIKILIGVGTGNAVAGTGDIDVYLFKIMTSSEPGVGDGRAQGTWMAGPPSAAAPAPAFRDGEDDALASPATAALKHSLGLDDTIGSPGHGLGPSGHVALLQFVQDDGTNPQSHC